MRLQKLRESLALVLLVVLPFHAFLVTVGTKLIAGPGHAPLAWLAVWKEGVLGVVLILAVMEWIFVACRPFVARVSNDASCQSEVRAACMDSWLFAVAKKHLTMTRCEPRRPRSTARAPQGDTLDFLILSLLALALFIPLAQSSPLEARSFVYGFKYDFVPLIAFLILRRVPWSEGFRRHLFTLLLIVGAIVALYGIASFFLPARFFSSLGYSDLHSLYLPGGPLAAFQQIGGSALRRIQSTFSGPNQLGIWLLLPLSIIFTFVRGGAPRIRGEQRQLPVVAMKHPMGIEEKATLVVPPHEGRTGGGLMRGGFFFASFFCAADRRKKVWMLLYAGLAGVLLIALFLSFSRSAWIAAFVMLIVALWMTLPKKTARNATVWIVALGSLVCILLFFLAPSILTRVTSTRAHLERPIAALRTIAQHPFGLGLGSAGPASNRVSDACVFLEAGEDASWAADRRELCVFVGSVQIQPVGRSCRCPVLPENWYLQIGVELGVGGMILYLGLVVVLLVRMGAISDKRLAISSEGNLLIAYSFQLTAFFFFLAVSIAALFLHAWEDSAVAYTAWILTAVALRPQYTSFK